MRILRQLSMKKPCAVERDILIGSGVEIVRFGTIGIAATLTHICVALGANEILMLSPVWSNFIAFIIASPVSYFGNYFWTFEANTSHKQSFPRFLFTSISALLLSQLIVWVVAGVMGYSLRLALVPALMIVPALSFVISRYWVFPAGK